MAYGSFNAGPGKAPDEDVVRTDQIGIPGGIATLDADGHLTESQRPENQLCRRCPQLCRECTRRHPRQRGRDERQH